MSVSAEIGTATLCLAPQRGAAEGGLRAPPRRRQSEPTSAFGPSQSRLVPARATPYPSRSEALRQAVPLPRERGEGRERGPVTGRSPEVSSRRGPGLCFQVAARSRAETPRPPGPAPLVGTRHLDLCEDSGSQAGWGAGAVDTALPPQVAVTT